MRSGFRKKWDDLDLKVEATFRKFNNRRKAKLRLKRMNGGFACDKEYKEIVLPYWKKYGYKPGKIWYKIYSNREQKVDPRYIPDDLYYGELIPYFSNSQFRRFGEDKCYHDVWIPDIKRPQTICKNIAGVYYDADMNPVTKAQAIAMVLAFEDEFLIKPSIDTGEGRLIQFFTKETATEASVEAAFDGMKANFILQAAVKQHPVLSQLNPSSLNTMRVITFFFEGEVHVLSCILRVGAPNSKVDNVGAGGYACAIKADGSLNDKAVNRKAEWVEETSTGIKFAGIRLPEFERVVDAVKKAHRRMAHFKLIGWDMSVDVDNDPVFIEYNTCPGANQNTSGPTFGDLTEKVLEEYFITRTLETAQN
ncbi:MAG: hypothetical protein IJB02_05780 [Oscillospiraceae bacterium]|nr:hypothetical protein [Oscillospiraceae bacterium]